jgi:hypothetical protein
MMLILVPSSQAQANTITLSTDQLIYPIWHVGGKVNVTGTGLTANATYYLWLQRPSEPSTRLTNASLQGGVKPLGRVTISAADPAGTYFLSLSNSSLQDYRLTSVHFGVFGANQNRYQRTVPVIVSGGGFGPNSTVTLQIKIANQSLPTVTLSSTPAGAIGYSYTTTPSTQNGTLSITAAGPSFDSHQTITTTYLGLITPAEIVFNVNPLVNLQRTDTLVVNATVYYPGGGIIAPENLTAGVNMTLSSTDFTISRILNFSDVSRSWYYNYFIPFNGTLGTYNLLLSALDPYGNSGMLAISTTISKAKLGIHSPPSVKVNQGQVVDITFFVTYPNGTLLTDQFGGKVTVRTNSTTGESGQYVMSFNSTDRRWHLFYTAPQLDMHFGDVVTFSFQAGDEYDNSGSAANAFQITVGANTATLVLAVIVAAIVPAVLLIWAIFTVTKRRRRYKP